MERATPSRRTTRALTCWIPLVIASLAVAGCEGSQPWGEMPKAFGVQYGTGDRADLFDAQLGLRGGESGLGQLTAEGGLELTGAVRAVCGPAGAGAHPAFRVRLAPVEPASFGVTVRVADYHGEGRYEGVVFVERVGEDGALLTSEGAAEVILDDATHRAAIHAVSGSFTAEVAGEAGGGTLEGSFEGCYFFT